MQNLTLAMLVVVTTFEFFAKGDYWGRWAYLPGGAQYLPELFGLAAIIVVILLGTRNRFQFIRPQYWIVFGALVVNIICGILVNEVDSGPIFAGIRTYLRAIPWFLVPAVFAFSNTQVTSQLRTLLVVALLQVPLSIQQRMTTVAQGSETGDLTSGTLLISSVMSIFLICGICIVAALFIRKRIQAWQFLVLSVLLLLPTTINETKGTLLLLPVGLLFAFLTAAKPGRRVRAIALACGLLAAFGAVFVPVYDYFNAEREYSVPLSEMVSDPARLEAYLWKKEDVGTTGQAGRVDSIVVPIRHLLADPAQAVFGYGIGNVSDSNLGHGFVGKRHKMFAPFLTTSFGRLVLELGFFGFGLVIALMWLIWEDCRIVARQGDDVVTVLAAAWVGVTVVIGLSLIYKDIVHQASLSYVFWYFSGLIAASRMRRLRNRAPTTSVVTSRPSQTMHAPAEIRSYRVRN